MGLLVEGVWQDRWYDTESSGGSFNRKESTFRDWITPDGSAGPTGEGGFDAQSGRYHLYVSYACPWAHRTLIFRALKGLEDHIEVSVVHPDAGPSIRATRAPLAICFTSCPSRETSTSGPILSSPGG